MITIKTPIKNIISILLVTAVLLPFAIQFSHALEKHEYSICHAQNKNHIDKHEINCAVLHYKITHNTITFSSNFSITENIIGVENIFPSEGHISSVKIHSISSRAPPVLAL